jgi:hypothetical protein
VGCQIERVPEICFRILAPLRGETLFSFVPVVLALLQPPATIWQPSGLMPTKLNIFPYIILLDC